MILWYKRASLPLLLLLSALMYFLCGGLLAWERRGFRLFNQLVEHAGLMCVVSVFNQRAARCRFDVDGELIKQYLWRLHQLQHFVLPLLAPPRQTAAVSARELKYSCSATSVPVPSRRAIGSLLCQIGVVTVIRDLCSAVPIWSLVHLLKYVQTKKFSQ